MERGAFAYPCEPSNALAGRDPESLELSLFAAPPEADAVKRFEDLGVDRMIFGLPPAGREQILPYLDQLRGLG